jgi:hypothetical protein
VSSGFAMAKKRANKPGPKPGPPAEQREEIIAVRCKSAYKEWLQEFADSERSTPTNLIDKGLAELAKALKFKAPPKR